MSGEVTVSYLGKATGPTPEMLAAAPYETFGFWLLATAFVLLVASAIVLAVRVRIAGTRLTILGLAVTLGYFTFQCTVAQDAGLRYGPWADAVALVAYGCGGLLTVLGYARLSLAIIRGQNGR
jgi:hypothetical protein